MDVRIGTIIRNGQQFFYAFANGYDAPETVGSLEEVEIALGLWSASPKQIAKRVELYRDYVVTLTWHGDRTEEEEIVVSAKNHSQAIQKGRDWKRIEYGRTRSCNLATCSFRARLASLARDTDG
jgi:hypothetical protein